MMRYSLNGCRVWNDVAFDISNQIVVHICSGLSPFAHSAGQHIPKRILLLNRCRGGRFKSCWRKRNGVGVRTHKHWVNKQVCKFNFCLDAEELLRPISKRMYKRTRRRAIIYSVRSVRLRRGHTLTERGNAFVDYICQVGCVCACVCLLMGLGVRSPQGAHCTAGRGMCADNWAASTQRVGPTFRVHFI